MRPFILASLAFTSLGLAASVPPSPSASVLIPESNAEVVVEGSTWLGDFSPAITAVPNPTAIADYRQYQQTIEKTAGMVAQPKARSLADQLGLNLLNVTWEDTGRYKSSAVGPNISDMTIQVQHQDPISGQYHLSLMPVVRYPNFEDKTADIALDDFFLMVGNEKDRPLQRTSLRNFLKNLRQHLHEPDSWKGNRSSLLAERDSHVLVSAQACFLPIPKNGKAEFNPVLFNYQSYAGDPAVLTILATREGTSVTVIDNQRDGFQAGATWGQRLFFNQNGDRASLTGERISDFLENSGSDRPDNSQATTENNQAQGLNVVLLIQVPLKQKQPPMRSQISSDVMESEAAMPLASAPMAKSDVEAAAISHGEVEGPFTEIDRLEIERDPRFPIRVTVQFYKATSNGVVSEADLQEIQQQIGRVYEDADYVGSLVVEGETNRPTEHDGPKQEPADWWERFWQRHKANTGQSKQDALQMWWRLRDRS